MAGNTTKTLQLVIAGQNRGAVTAVDGVGRSVVGLRGELKGLAAGFAGVLSVGALTAAGKKVIDQYQQQAGNVAKIKRLTGESAEDSSLLAFAAQQSGVDANKAATAWQFLAKNIDNGKVAAAGIATTAADGKLLPFDDILGKIANKFQTLPPGVERTGLALKLFGRGGADMVKVLSNGAEGIEDLRSKMQDLGLTIDEDGLKKYSEFVHAQRDMKAAVAGVEVQIAQGAVPVLTGLANAATKVTETFGHLPAPLRDAVLGIGGLTAGVLGASAAVGVFGPIVASGLRIFHLMGPATTEAAAGTGSLVAANAALEAQMAASAAASAAFNDTILLGGTAEEAGVAADQARAASLATVTVETEAASVANTGFIASTKATIAGLGGVQGALLAGVAGWQAYSQTTGFLESRFGSFHGDTEQLSADLVALGRGQADVSEVTKQFGGDIDSLSSKIGANSNDSLSGRLKSLATGALLTPFGGGDSAFGAQQASADLDALNGSLLGLVKSGKEADASAAFGKITAELIRNGVSIERINAAFGPYLNGRDGAAAAAKREADATKGSTEAIAENAKAIEEQAAAREADQTKAISDAEGLYDAQQKAATSDQDRLKANAALAEAQRAAAGDSDESRRATEAVTSAQKDQIAARSGVVDALRSVGDAQKDLNDARADAVRKLEDLQIAERDAVLAQHEAQAGLRSTFADPDATPLDRERASVRLADANDKARQATQDHNTAEAKGVEGSDQVVAARKKVTDANQSVADAEDKVRDSTEKVGAAQAAQKQVIVDAKAAVVVASAAAEAAVRTEADAWGELVAQTDGANAGLLTRIALLQKLGGDPALLALLYQINGVHLDKDTGLPDKSIAAAESYTRHPTVNQTFNSYGTPRQNTNAAAAQNEAALNRVFAGAFGGGQP